MSVVTFLRIIFIILSIIGVSFVFPIGTAVACGEFAVLPSFVIPMLISFVLGAAAIFVRNEKRKFTISTRGVFVIVSCAWIAISFFGTIPLAASGYIPNFTNAFFESVSGFSTTGASVIVDLDVLPRSLNLWRCEMHWLGGMGVIALTVALLPLLGVGGFRLIKAETTGVDKGKITPKITTTAKTLWILYVSLTAAQTVLLCIAGMDFVSALSYSFSTLGTGGYSVTNAGFEGYSEAVEIICTVFMILGGINFSLYFYAITGKWNEVRKNSELKAYAGILFVAMFGVTLILIPYYHSVVQALRFATFQVASIMTTTGFATADYTLWPQPAQFILFVLFFVGGSAGSTAGGFKVVRWLVLAKQARNEILRMLHPHGIFTVRLNGMPGRKDLVFSVSAFLFVYLSLVVVTTFFGTIAGLDMGTAMTTAFSMVSNVGPAFGRLGPMNDYHMLPVALKWWYCFAMIAGRLELYDLIIFFIPDYWKK